MTAQRLSVYNATRGTVVAARVVAGGGFWSSLRGLMGHPGLVADEGLWLPGVNNIHMLFMRFRIDALFLTAPAADGTRTVSRLHAALPPWRGVVWYARGARGVLELAAGAAARSGTVVGDRLVLAPADGDTSAV